jgi:protein-tyrosine phosphatase
MIWVHLPIHDYCVPSETFEENWQIYGKYIRTRLRNGENIVIHCKGGLGRAGMIAARLLAELGVDPERAIRLVRMARSGAIETPGQLALVRKTKPIIDDIKE